MLTASVVIPTFNRRSALGETLRALAEQSVPRSSYEIIVVDDGSSDGTWDELVSRSRDEGLRVIRQPRNSGVAAARNAGMRAAAGQHVVLVSDDLIVPPTFIEAHLDDLGRYPHHWVVGGFTQDTRLTATSPFARYVERLEASWQASFRKELLEPGCWEVQWPTARNLSLRKADLERVGLFDEQFRSTCEDQDLAYRASQLGIRFLYDSRIECVHNDQSGDLFRYCRFQERGAHDTALFCHKHAAWFAENGKSTLHAANDLWQTEDSLRLKFVKLAKWCLSRRPALALLLRMVAATELIDLPEPVRQRLYRMVLGLHIFRGWRAGLKSIASGAGVP